MRYNTPVLFQTFLFVFPVSSASGLVLSALDLVMSAFSTSHSWATLEENHHGERRRTHGNRSSIDRQASELALARTAVSRLDSARAGYDSGQIAGLGQEMAQALA